MRSYLLKPARERQDLPQLAPMSFWKTLAYRPIGLAILLDFENLRIERGYCGGVEARSRYSKRNAVSEAKMTGEPREGSNRLLARLGFID